MRVKVLSLQYLLCVKYLKFYNSEEVDKVSASLTVFTFTQGIAFRENILEHGLILIEAHGEAQGCSVSTMVMMRTQF